MSQLPGIRVFVDGYYLYIPAARKINVKILKRFGDELAILMGLERWRKEIADYNGKKFVDAVSTTDKYDTVWLDGATLIITSV